MEFQEVKKDKQKIEEDFKKILIEFENKYGMIVENIEIKRVYEIGGGSKLLSLGLSLRLK